MFKGIQKDKLQTGGTKSWWCKSWCKRNKDFQLKRFDKINLLKIGHKIFRMVENISVNV